MDLWHVGQLRIWWREVLLGSYPLMLASRYILEPQIHDQRVSVCKRDILLFLWPSCHELISIVLNILFCVHGMYVALKTRSISCTAEMEFLKEFLFCGLAIHCLMLYVLNSSNLTVWKSDEMSSSSMGGLVTQSSGKDGKSWNLHSEVAVIVSCCYLDWEYGIVELWFCLSSATASVAPDCRVDGNFWYLASI